MTKKIQTPVPRRDSSAWKAYKAVRQGNCPNSVLNKFADRSRITCRDCWGFGHSVKRCPTASKFEAMKQTNQIAKSGIHRIRAHSFNIDATESWPFLDKAKEQAE